MNRLKCLVVLSSSITSASASTASSLLSLCRPRTRLQLQLQQLGLLMTNATIHIADTFRPQRLLGPLSSKVRGLANCSTGQKHYRLLNATKTTSNTTHPNKHTPLSSRSFLLTTSANQSQLLYQTKQRFISTSSSSSSSSEKSEKQIESSNTSSSTSVKVLPKRTIRAIRKKKQPIGVTELPEKFNMAWPKITLFGDSLTRRAFDVENGCWGSMLANKVGDYFDVDARGFAGYNTRWALDMMPKLFPRAYLDQVELFVLLFGHNDSWEASNPLHCPVDEYEKNLNSMIQYLLNNGLSRSKMILITPNWYHLPTFTQYHIDQGLPTTQKEFRDTVKYGEAVIRIARKEQIDYLDAFALSYKHDPLEELFCDGVHYSLKGAKLLFEHLWPIVDRKLADSFRKPTNKLFHGTPWDEIPTVKVVLDAHTRKLEAEARARRGY